MNERLKQFLAKAKEFWAKWSIIQKIIVIGIVVAVIAAFIVMTRVSSAPTTVPLFNRPITDQNQQANIIERIERENYKVWISEDGVVSVENESVARRMRTILYDEGLADSSFDAYSIFDVTNWSTTDFERNINKKRAAELKLQQMIESYSDISRAMVAITPPKDALFAQDKEPAKVAVVLTFKARSSMASDRKKIRAIQETIMGAVEGIREDMITIQDTEGNILNDFEGMAETDRLDNLAKEQKLREKEEARLRAAVLTSLQKNFSENRVRDLIVSIEWDMSNQTDDSTTYTPIMITEQDPTKPYDTTEKRDYLPISSQTITREWTGTGYNPEGPAGVEGQNPPVYSDMSNVIGKSTETSVNQNNVMNTTQSHREVHFQPGRRSVSVNIDGHWDIETSGDGTKVFVTEKNWDELKEKYPESQWKDGENIRFKLGHILRTYRPVSDDQLVSAASFVQGAINYNQARGDTVSVTSWSIPHDDEWDAEDEAIRKKEQTRKTIILTLVGIVAVCIAFIVFRFISKEMERKRRQREEELLRQQQAAREKALWEAKDQDMEVTMSVEERKRAELQENAIAMAKEHPEDVAMLIRTWMMEE